MQSQSQYDYDQIYRQLLSTKGREELGEDPLRQEAMVQKIQKFLDTYPERAIPMDRNPDAPIYRISLVELYRRTLQTAIDVIQDVSTILTQRNYVSKATFRRKMFEAFTKKERRVYMGVWLIVTSFILYFIDSAA
jgi:hypothetical protein